MMRFGSVYASEPGYQMGIKYVKGLIGTAARKNGWQLSEYLGKTTPYAVQQFLYRGRFSANRMRDIIRDYIGEKLGEEDGVLVVDETGFLKQWKKSCGVKRQYSGTAGRIENCQIGVFLTYASKKGHSAIDRRLDIPEEWVNDRQRRKEAQSVRLSKGDILPETLTFKTKNEMAIELLSKALSSNTLGVKWVGCDASFGSDHGLFIFLLSDCFIESIEGCFVLPKSIMECSFYQNLVAFKQ